MRETGTGDVTEGRKEGRKKRKKRKKKKKKEEIYLQLLGSIQLAS